MNALFRLFRSTLVPGAIAAYSVVWLVHLIGGCAILLPLAYFWNTLTLAVKSPFVFLGAAMTDDVAALEKMTASWREANSDATEALVPSPYAEGLETIANWVKAPDGDVAWLVGLGNVATALAVAAALSETVRVVLLGLVAVLVVLIIWANA